MSSPRRLTALQVEGFLAGKPVRVNPRQLTTIIRYMASQTPVAVTRVGELSPRHREYIVVSLRRIPGAGAVAEEWLQQETTMPDDNLEEVREAVRHLVD